MADGVEQETLSIRVSEDIGQVSALLLRPGEAAAVLVFAHGAGAGMHHAFMQDMAQRLAAHGVATLRFQFPYMQAAHRRPDPPPVLRAAACAALERAAACCTGLALFAGGKSMGGRMYSQAAAEAELPLNGLIFFGFPLHPAGKPGIERAAHLARVAKPMLFLQGSRDRLADLQLLRAALSEYAPAAELEVLDDADHSFHVPKRSGRDDAAVRESLAQSAQRFIRAHGGARGRPTGRDATRGRDPDR